MSQNCLGSYILGNPLGSAALGDLVRAMPFEGAPAIRLVQALPAVLSKHPDAAALVQRNARQWASVRDLHSLSLVAFEQDGDAPFMVYEYQQGRLLSDILARCHQEGLPLSADQAVYIAERLAGALLSVSASGTAFGCLTAQRVLVTFEGEVKLLPGAFRDLHTTSIAADPSLMDYRRSLPPGLGADKATRLSADRYALGALMFELLAREPFRTADGPFDPAARIAAARAGESGLEPLPDALTAILQRACVLESSEAYEDLAAMKGDLDQLITSGEYSPTTFNIAFLMHTLFRGEDEADTAADQSFLAMDREAFKPAPPPPPPPVVVTAPEAPKPAPKPAPPREEPAPSFGMLDEEPPPDRKGLFIGLGVAAGVLAIVFLSYFAFFREKGPSQAETAAREQLAKMQKEQAEMSARMKSLEDEKAQLASQVANAKTTEEKQKAQKALEDTQKKLQAQKDEQKRLADQAAAAAAAAPAAGEKAPPPTPSQVADKAPASPPPTTPAAPPTTTAGTQPPPEKAAAPSPAPASAPAPAAEATVRPGDFVEMWGLDVKPKQINDLRVNTPSAAVSQHLTGTVYVEVQIDETGKVTGAKVVKGLGADFGLNAACEEAALKLKFSPAISKGVPVKTKMTFPILFK
jgi:TonB family protein